MRYWQIFQESFDLTKTSKFVLLYFSVSLIAEAIPETQSETALALTCAFLIIRLTLLVLSTILIAGFIYSIYELVTNEVDVSIRVGFLRAQSCFFSIVFLSLIMYIPWLLAYGIVWLAFSRMLTPITATLVGLFLFPIMSYGICAIVIDKHSIFKSITFSLFVMRKNFVQSFSISGIFIIMQYALLSLFVWLLTSPFDPQNSLQLGFDYKTLQIPFVSKANQIIGIVLMPLQTAVFTLIYLIFKKKTSPMKQIS